MTQSIPQPTKIQPGSETHFALLGAEFGYNFLGGHEYRYMQQFAKKVWDAALSQPMGVAGIPPGMALVPIEPTPEMLAATDIEDTEYYFHSMQGAHKFLADHYRAMVAAAPRPDHSPEAGNMIDHPPEVTKLVAGQQDKPGLSMSMFASKADFDAASSGDAAAQGEWQPIETAPAEGVFLVFMPTERDGKRMQPMLRRKNFSTIGDRFDFDCESPTLWHEMPAAPSIGTPTQGVDHGS